MWLTKYGNRLKMCCKTCGTTNATGKVNISHGGV